MKKLAKLFAIAASLTALIFSGCSNLVDDASIEGESIKLEGSRRLTLYATGSTDNLVFPESSGRMILPAALDGTGLTFVLFAENQLDSTKKTAKKVTFAATSGSNGRTGTVDIDLDTSKYSLTLYALKADITVDNDYSTALTAVTGNANTVLKATATVDMRYNEKVSLYLTPYALEGDGSINLTFKTDWDIPSPYKDANTGINFIIANMKDNATVTSSPFSTTADLTGSKLNKTWSGTVAAGTYNLVVKFNLSATKSYVWSDVIVVLKNQTTEATINVPNVIGTLPVAPTGFTAKYSEPETENSDYYDVEFIWDASKTDNEQYFQIELLNPDTSTTDGDKTYANLYTMNGANASFAVATANTNWASVKTNGGTVTTFDKLVYAEPNYQAGSLNTNSTSVVVSLPLGVRYMARIAAVNDAGPSEYAYVNLTYIDDNSTGTAWTDFVEPVAYKRRDVGSNVTPAQFNAADSGANAVGINLFRVKYDLANGIYALTTYTGTTASGSAVTPPDVGEISNVKADITAEQAQIPTLNGTKTADIRYYTQLYDSVNNTATVTGVALNNPLNEEYTTTGAAPTTNHYSLYKGGANWTGWKADSTSGTTVYTVDIASDRTVALPDQILKGTAAAVTDPATYVVSDSDGSYPGYKNLSLFAVYGAASVTVFNPADYAILDCDAVLLKGTASGIGSAVQIATLDSSKSFNINNDKTAGYQYLYIALRETNYESVRVKVTSQSYGTLFDKKVNVGVEASKTELTGNKRYVLTTSQPSDWVAGFANYAKFANGKYTALDATEAWAADTFYKIVTDATQFTYFEIPLTTTFGAGTYTITIMGYNKNNPKTPYTYPVTMNVKESATAVYSPTTFEPYNWTADKAKYFKTTDPTDVTKFVANDGDDWTKGTTTSTYGIWQKD